MDGLGKFLVSLGGGPCIVVHDINSNVTIPTESTESDMMHMMHHQQTTPWAHMEDKQLLNILSYLNYSDLLQCRLISRYFRHIISKSQLFLRSTTFISSSEPDLSTDPSILENTSIPFENVRFEHIDQAVFVGARSEDKAYENPTFNPPTFFLSHLKSIQFQNCYITWETIKRIVTTTPKLEQFSIIRCKFEDRATLSPLGEFEEFRVGRTFSTMKSIKIMEHCNLKAVNKCLEKLVGYCSHTLQDLFVTFDPTSEEEASGVEQGDMESFCNLTRDIIEVNISVLQKFSMDLKYPPLLNMFIPSVFGKMDSLWEELNLVEFSLSPPGCTPTPRDIEISNNTISSAQILIGFLESQTQLRKAAIPHFRNMGEQHYKWKLGRSLAPGIEYLCVPNQDYLPQEFLSRYPALKKLYVGGSVGDDSLPVALRSEMFDCNNPESVEVVTATAEHYQPVELPAHLDLNLALSGSTYTTTTTAATTLYTTTSRNKNDETWDKFEELGIGSTIINGEELMKIIRKFHFLTKLEVTSEFPVMQDEDVQALIWGMPWLQVLNVAACQYLSDFGVTGILRNSCEMMVRLQNYHEVQESSVLLNTRMMNHGKPLSQLTGLRSLVLMGESHITDVGVHFGFRFQELQTACLPYNKNLTDWGIKKFGDHNPSLQIFTMCTINQRSKDGFLHLQSNHPRVRKNKCTYMNYIVEEHLPVAKEYDSQTDANTESDPSATNFMGGLCSVFTFPWFSSSPKSEIEIEIENDAENVTSIITENAEEEPEEIPSSPQNIEMGQQQQVGLTKCSKLPKPQAGKSEIIDRKINKNVVWNLDWDDDSSRNNNA